MAYAEKRSGTLTGKWIGEVLTKKSGRFKKAFDTKKGAEAYEAFVRMMGCEPPTLADDGSFVTDPARAFRSVAEACKAAGGPRGKWKRGKDHSILQRLDYAVARIGGVDIGDVTRALIREKIVKALRKSPADTTGKPLAQGTINRYTSAVSAVLTWAVQEDVIKAKPTLEFSEEDDREERSVIDFGLERRILGHLLGAGRPIHATCVRWLAMSGMRLGELYKLTPEQIANDHVALEKEQTKTNVPRTVYVRPELCREMRAIIAAGALPGRTRLLKVFQDAAKAAGSDSHVVLHGLRHTRATRLMEAGVPREVRMYILGHRDKDVHAGYVHVSLEAQREADAAVERKRGEWLQTAAGANVQVLDIARGQSASA